MSENPYAPPTTNPAIHSSSSISDVIVELDGYRHGKEFLVNKHFISPPYCAKLGIPTGNAPTPITINRFTVYHPAIIELIRVIVLFICAGLSFYLISANNYDSGLIFIAITVFCIFSALLTRFTTRPYQINVPLSTSYRNRQKFRRYIYATLTVLVTLGIAKSATDNIHLLGVLVPILGLIALMFFRKSSKFVVVKQSGDYYYLRGAHPEFLAQLPDFSRNSH